MDWVVDKTAKNEDSTLNDEKVKEILSDNKSYVKEAKATSFITTKGEYEILYSELYNAPVVSNKLSDNELKALLQADSNTVGQIDADGNITSKLLWKINPLNETECELLGEQDWDYGPTPAYLGDSTNKDLEGGFPIFIKKENIIYKVTVIGEGAMGGLKIEDLDVPEGITKLGEGAFANCFDLKTISLPKTLTEIGEGTFCFCTSLKTIEIPDNVETIGAIAFSDCSNLESIIVGTNVKNIGDSFTFWAGRNALSTVTIKSATIANGLSSNTSQGRLINNATTIYIKDNITTIGSYVTSNYTQSTSDNSGYLKYVKN